MSKFSNKLLSKKQKSFERGSLIPQLNAKQALKELTNRNSSENQEVVKNESSLLKKNKEKKLSKESISSPVNTGDPNTHKETVSNGFSLGSCLKEARAKLGYSINQVALETKINVHYLEAIERDDFKNTPPFIYVKAYVKKLCSLYSLDVDSTLSLLKPFGDDRHVSDVILHELEESRQVNLNHEKKVLFYVKVIGGIIIAAIVVIIILLLVYFLKDKSGIVDKPLGHEQVISLQKDMEKLINIKPLSATQLPMPEAKN